VVGQWCERDRTITEVLMGDFWRRRAGVEALQLQKSKALGVHRHVSLS